MLLIPDFTECINTAFSLTYGERDLHADARICVLTHRNSVRTGRYKTLVAKKKA